MKLYTNKISTGKAKRFEDFVADFRRKNQVKTASVKTAGHDEADSSGQLDVEPLHQEGESTTMPKAGPSAKKDDGEKSAVATKEPDAEGPDSGQSKAEGSEKFTNDPEAPSKEEKGGSIDGKVKVAEECSCGKEDCDGSCTCSCKSCTATRHEAVKIAGEKGMCDCGKPNFICKGKCKGDDSSDDSDCEPKAKDDEEKEKEEKEAKVDEDKDEEKEAKVEEKDKEEKKSAKKVKFVKIANLDEKNKSFLKDYWRQLFGDDYVNANIIIHTRRPYIFLHSIACFQCFRCCLLIEH